MLRQGGETVGHRLRPRAPLADQQLLGESTVSRSRLAAAGSGRSPGSTSPPTTTTSCSRRSPRCRSRRSKALIARELDPAREGGRDPRRPRHGRARVRRAGITNVRSSSRRTEVTTRPGRTAARPAGSCVAHRQASSSSPSGGGVVVAVRRRSSPEQRPRLRARAPSSAAGASFQHRTAPASSEMIRLHAPRRDRVHRAQHVEHQLDHPAPPDRAQLRH